MRNEERLRKAANRVVSTGLRNMLRRENRRWWRLRSLLWLLIVWTVLVNGLIVVLGISIPNLTAEGEPVDPALVQNVMAGIFFLVGGLAIALGAIIRGHDSVLKERESGTAAWMVSKPVSRSDFVMSKMIANGIGMLATIVLVQGVITYVLIALTLGRPPDAVSFFSGLSLLGLNCVFFVALAVSLSTLFSSRGITLGLPILVAMGGFVLALLCRYSGIMPSLAAQLNVLSPANLNLLAWNAAGGTALSGTDMITVIAAIVWVAIFLAAALVKFERTEL
jgi:ABC-2 type transport system permease protein